MDTILLAMIVGLIASVISTAAIGLAVFYLFKSKIVESKTVFEEPMVKRHILVPNEGIFVLKDKRACKFRSEEDEYLREQDELRKGQ